MSCEFFWTITLLLIFIDFDVKTELERIACYKPLYDNALFKTVMFKNKRIYWNEQFDFHLDQILAQGHLVKSNP